MKYNVYSMVMSPMERTLTKVKCDLLDPVEVGFGGFRFNIRFEGLSSHVLWCDKNSADDYGYDSRLRVAFGLSRNKVDVIRQEYIEKGYRAL